MSVVSVSQQSSVSQKVIQSCQSERLLSGNTASNCSDQSDLSVSQVVKSDIK